LCVKHQILLLYLWYQCSCFCILYNLVLCIWMFSFHHLSAAWSRNHAFYLMKTKWIHLWTIKYLFQLSRSLLRFSYLDFQSPFYGIWEVLRINI
jgi:hypothetical protein